MYDKKARRDGRWIKYTPSDWFHGECTVYHFSHGERIAPDTLYSDVPIRDINPDVEVIDVRYYENKRRTRVVPYVDGQPDTTNTYYTRPSTMGRLKRKYVRGWRNSF
jgi:hypothetical protein